ncbi:O-antigen ligase family protein [Mycolicibacterium pallens]|uniref:Uncharacterized protein n=1 Tax=Mycolicibacterium pallens TaxID=370524 RepID=A0ABX8VI92_9MYCO|nr:hypothetical protein [Mycolicibacterium pallens]QYL17533.1 hypothetical protein K0O64_02850 [Mycolicibacterium pallens]
MTVTSARVRPAPVHVRTAGSIRKVEVLALPSQRDRRVVRIEGPMLQRSRLFITRDTVAVLLVVMMWGRVVGALIVLSLTTEKTFVRVGQGPISTPASRVTTQLFFLMAVGIGIAVVLFRINDVTRPGLWRLLVVLAPWLCILTRDLYYRSPTPDSALFLVVVLALAALRPNPRRVLTTLGALVVLTAIIAIAIGFLRPEAGIVREPGGIVRARADKGVFPSLGLLQGMFTSENNLGLYLAVGAAAVATLPRWWLRLPSLGIVVFAVCWSSSRNEMFAIACMLVVGIVVGTLVELGRRPAASAVARIATATALVTMCVLPFMGWEADAFTGRAAIWKGSLIQWSSRAIFEGFGHDWYGRIGRDTSELGGAAFEAHNQFIQFLVTGGVILAFVAVGSLFVQTYAITVSRSRYLTIAAMLVTGICVSGFLEDPLGFVDRGEFWTVTIVPLTVLFFARPGETRVTRTGDTCQASSAR